MDYLSSLNQGQRAAVEHISGPLLIVAGAGTGKTKTLTTRIWHLIQSGVTPSNILAITFTNKAAREMRERLESKLSLFSERPFIGTFHSLGVKILRENSGQAHLVRDFTILDQEDSLSILKEALRDVGLDPKQVEPRKIRGVISWQKNHFVSREEFAKRDNDYMSEVAAKVWEKYEEKIKKERAVDCDDLLVKTVKLLQEEKEARDYYQNLFQFVSVDEYQDTNIVQERLVRILGEHQNICVVGDVDQSIYSWRGATIINMINFEKIFPGTKTDFLEENYRSTKNILLAANEVIKKNELRQDKKLFTERETGEPILLTQTFDEKDEAVSIVEKILELKRELPLEEIAILYRTNWQSRVLEEALINSEIPYQIFGVKFFARKEIKDVLGFVRAALNPESLTDIKRIINLPPRGIGKVTLLKIFAGKVNELTPALKEKVSSFYELLKNIKWFAENHLTAETMKFVIKESGLEELLRKGNEEDLERLENIKELVSLAKKYDNFKGLEGIQKLLEEAALNSDEKEVEEKEEKKGVKLMTIHGAKGLEFDAVFVTGLEEDLFPHVRSEGASDIEEERRLFYVAITRARKKLFLSFAHNRTIFGNRKNNLPSQFLADLPSEVVQFEQSDFMKDVFEV